MDVNDNCLLFKTEDDNNEIYVRGNNPMGTYVTKVKAQNRNSSENGL